MTAVMAAHEQVPPLVWFLTLRESTFVLQSPRAGPFDSQAIEFVDCLLRTSAPILQESGEALSSHQCYRLLVTDGRAVEQSGLWPALMWWTAPAPGDESP